jgi:hypothetical protein
MNTKPISKQLTGLMLIAALLSNITFASGLSSCHCSTSKNACCCKTPAKAKKSCCQKLRKTKSCQCSQSSCRGSSCQCGCQNRSPVPVAPTETSQSRLQLEFSYVSSFLTTLVYGTSGNDDKSLVASSDSGSSIPPSVQVLCCTWLT